MIQHGLPRWIVELRRYLPIKTLFLLHGNIYDQFLYPASDGDTIQWSYLPLRRLLCRFFQEQRYGLTAFFDQVDGFNFITEQERQAFEQIIRGKGGSRGEVTHTAPGATPSGSNEEDIRPGRPQVATLKSLRDTDAALDALRKALNHNDLPVAFVLDYASRLLTSPGQLSQKERQQFIKLLKASQEASRKARGFIYNHVIVLICNKLNDLPAWLYLENPLAKPLYIPLPQPEERRRYFEIYSAGFYKAAELPSEERDRTIESFVDLTRALSSYELESLRVVSHREEIPFNNPKSIIERYKFGVVVSPWEMLNREQGRARLAQAESVLRQRVKGQETAIRAVVDIIKRAATGLSGVHHSATAHKPRGILFFAGPTGVGKTEMAKALAELLFGDEDTCIRFDMSEYAQEHSDQRLLGAPPGYVGYEEGGQLTNKLKDSPFAVLLFDEIEKAHPKIMDKFLQILEDGRMTDGKGETVYFSESVIIFTSNIGAYVDLPVGENRVVRKPNVLPYSWRCGSCGAFVVEETSPSVCLKCRKGDFAQVETPYEYIKERILKAVEEHFKLKLGRPEIYNRIGNNFIVFDYIRAEVTRQIIEKILSNIQKELSDKKKLSLEFAQPVSDFLLHRAAGNIEQGGRGIGNLIETALVNPLARIIFDQNLKDTALLVKSITEEQGGNTTIFSLETEVSRAGKESARGG